MKNEECWVLMGRRRRWYWKAKYDRYTVGVPAQVAFDPDYVWENRDKVVGWCHSHPNWTADLSSTDNSTMKAMVCSLGKPLLCCITGTDGLRAHWYLDDESDPVEVRAHRCRGHIFGENPNIFR